MVLQIRTLLARETSRWMFLNTVPCSMFYIETIFMYFSFMTVQISLSDDCLNVNDQQPHSQSTNWGTESRIIMIDWLSIAFCSVFVPRIFHSRRSHHFSHLLLRQCVPSFETIKQKKSWDIKHLTPLGWVVIITWSSKVSSKP